MSWFILSTLFGIFGTAYFIYGRNTGKGVPLASGALLCLFPYFVGNLFALVAVGLLLLAAPFFLEI